MESLTRAISTSDIALASRLRAFLAHGFTNFPFRVAKCVHTIPPCCRAVTTLLAVYLATWPLTKTATDYADGAHEYILPLLMEVSYLMERRCGILALVGAGPGINCIFVRGAFT